MSEEQVNKQVQSTLEAFALKIKAVLEDVEFVADQLDFWDRLQAPGDSEYDFYFGAEGHTPDEASKLWIHNSISSISVELQHLFARGLQRIGVWQDEFECEQSELNENLLEVHLDLLKPPNPNPKNQTLNRKLLKVHQAMLQLQDAVQNLPLGWDHGVQGQGEQRLNTRVTSTATAMITARIADWLLAAA